MKLLKRLTHTILRRVPVHEAPQITMRAITEPSQLRMTPDHCRYRFSVELWAETTGPSAALDEMRRRALRILLRELYGEVADEIHLTLRDLMQEEHYRPNDDPVLTRLNALLRKLSEGDVR